MSLHEPSFVRTEIRSAPGGCDCFVITLAAPRANALEPDFLAAIEAAQEDFEDTGLRRALICGGRNFSTGGDVGRFLEAACDGQAVAYAERVVPLLQRCVLRMIGQKAIVALAGRGAITGGSAGFLFASDLAVLAPDAFVQPYYGVMGFAPDGGWTATLPERIGAGAAQDWLLNDRRFGAEELMARGLACAVDPDPENAALARLAALDIDMALAGKALIWDAARRAQVEARLAAETEAFRALIPLEATRAKMAAFLGKEA